MPIAGQLYKTIVRSIGKAAYLPLNQFFKAALNITEHYIADMAPVAINQREDVAINGKDLSGHCNIAVKNSSHNYATDGPLRSTGALDHLESIDLTPVIGKEFPTANLVDMMQDPNADALLKELAYTISSHGVVFLRKQDNLTNDLQKQLIQRLGELGGKPATSGLHIHPVLNTETDVGEKRDTDKEISTISSKLFTKLYDVEGDNTVCAKKQSSNQWHSDIAFEPVPADYTSLRLTQLPKTGGDTQWASGYELYDRLSPPYQKFVESLTATFAQPGFNAAAERGNFKLYDKPRGAPENVGSVLKAVHPVVRTNPVTGWKSIYPVGGHVSHINGFTKEESKTMLDWFKQLCVDNHDLQVRFKWKNVNDIAIWDNRCTFHNAMFDYNRLGDRFGNRAVGLGERPFFDAKSSSRREALEKEGVEIGKPFLSRS